MNPGGLVIVVAGVWLGCQVFGGNMLERVGILKGSGTAGGTAPSVNLPNSPGATSNPTSGWT